MLEKKPVVVDASKGITTFLFSQYQVKILNATQTIAAINPYTDTSFDYTPGKLLPLRSGQGMNQLGDINLQWRVLKSAHWQQYSSAMSRLGIRPLERKKNDLMASELVLPPAVSNWLQIKRYWRRVRKNSKTYLTLNLLIKNHSSDSVEIGALGFPMIFNNILHGESLEQAHTNNSFYDPYMGMNAGYLQVVRLDGKGPVLLVLPDGNTPFENYRPLFEDPTPIGLDFEGFYEWQTLSKSYATNEWKDAVQWNNPHQMVLPPGQEKIYGLQLILADSVKSIEKTLIAQGHPVAVGIPGYVLPMDVQGTLFIHSKSDIRSIEATPKNAIQIIRDKETNGWKKFMLKGLSYGRSRLTIRYADGNEQTVHYKVIFPENKRLLIMGSF